MSMPNIPDVNPDICLCYEDVINLLLSSIALEEIALSQIISAESEKLCCFINSFKCCDSKKELIEINTSVEKVLHEVGLIESMLITKIKTIEEIYDFDNECNIKKLSKHCDCNYDFQSNECNCCKCNNEDCKLNCCNECDCSNENCCKFEPSNCPKDSEECYDEVNNNLNNSYKCNDYKNNINGIYTTNIDYYKNYNKLSDLFNRIFRGNNRNF